MRFYPGGPLVPVTWFRASPTAEVFTELNCFASTLWDTDETWGELGESQTTTRVWANGQKPAGLAGFPPVVGLNEDFSQGQPIDDLGEIVDLIGEPEQCITYPDSTKLGLGGVRVGVGAGYFKCCPRLPVTLTMNIPPGSACPCLDDLTIALHKTDPITWEGSISTPSFCPNHSPPNDIISCVFKLNACDALGNPNNATLDLTWGTHGTAHQIVDNGATCSPPFFVFSDVDFPLELADCAGAIGVIVS